MIAMETVMGGFDDNANFYRGYLPERRELMSLAITLMTIVAMWLLVYLVAAIGPTPAPVQPYSGLLAAHFEAEAAHR